LYIKKQIKWSKNIVFGWKGGFTTAWNLGIRIFLYIKYFSHHFLRIVDSSTFKKFHFLSVGGKDYFGIWGLIKFEFINVVAVFELVIESKLIRESFTSFWIFIKNVHPANISNLKKEFFYFLSSFYFIAFI